MIFDDICFRFSCWFLSKVDKQGSFQRVQLWIIKSESPLTNISITVTNTSPGENIGAGVKTQSETDNSQYQLVSKLTPTEPIGDKTDPYSKSFVESLIEILHGNSPNTLGMNDVLN